MRRFPAASICVALVFVARPVSARADGFYLGGHYYRAMPERVANRAPLIPLPVPRPRFETDARPSLDRKALDTKPSDSRSASDTSKPAESKPAVSKSSESKSSETKPSVTKPSASKPTEPGPLSSARPSTVPVRTPPSADRLVTSGVPLPPSKPADIAAPASPPAARAPTIAPSGASTAFAPRSPADDTACAGRLATRGVVAEPTEIGPQPDERCTVVRPVRLESLVLRDGGTVSFPDRPVIACTTADMFSLYVRDLLSPLAKGSYGAAVSVVWTGPGLECRSRDHIFGAKLSAHGQGLAVDIAQLKLGDGHVIAVGDPKTDVDTAFETAARAGACGYFHTVLGPGSDQYHRTHWHFDLEVRGAAGDSKYCR